MKRFMLKEFDLDALILEELEPPPSPGPGEVCFAPRALSLNYRDYLVTTGQYNPRLKRPLVPISDAAGVVVSLGEGVEGWQIGDIALTCFVPDWMDGRFQQRYLKTTLGTPGPGLAATQVVLPSSALVAMPASLSFAEAATLPIAALTARSALVTSGALDPEGQNPLRVLTLGTGGVSLFALALGKTLGAQLAVTSSSDDKLERCQDLGADFFVNYRTTPEWHRPLLEWSEGEGVDLVVENGGAKTLSESLRCVRADGRIALLGALTGLKSEIDIAPLIMKRVHIDGIMVDSRARLLELLRFVEERWIPTGQRPVIDQTYPFEQLPEALAALARGAHFGKIVIEISESDDSASTPSD